MAEINKKDTMSANKMSVNANNTNAMNPSENANVVESGKSVENSEVSQSVEVTGQRVVELESGGMYYGCRNGSCDEYKLVIVTNIEHSRGKKMVDYIQITQNKAIGLYDDFNTICTFDVKEYRSSIKLTGNYESAVRHEYVDGPNGVCALHSVTIEDIEKNVNFNYGTFRMDENMFNEFGSWINTCLGIPGIKCVKVGEENKDRVNGVMEAYASEIGYCDEDKSNAIDYFTSRKKALEDAAIIVDDKLKDAILGSADFNTLIGIYRQQQNILERLYIYKMYIEILSVSW